MSESIIPAKPDQNIWVPSPGPMRPFSIIPVIGWAVAPHGPPVPITVAGRLDKSAEYILGDETGWILLPSGHKFQDWFEVSEYMRARRA